MTLKELEKGIMSTCDRNLELETIYWLREYKKTILKDIQVILNGIDGADILKQIEDLLNTEIIKNGK